MWGGKKNWADMLKQPQAPPATLPPSGSLQAPLPDTSQNESTPPDQQLVLLILLSIRMKLSHLDCASFLTTTFT